MYRLVHTMQPKGYGYLLDIVLVYRSSWFFLVFFLVFPLVLGMHIYICICRRKRIVFEQVLLDDIYLNLPR